MVVRETKGSQQCCQRCARENRRCYTVRPQVPCATNYARLPMCAPPSASLRVLTCYLKRERITLPTHIKREGEICRNFPQRCIRNKGKTKRYIACGVGKICYIWISYHTYIRERKTDVQGIEGTPVHYPAANSCGINCRSEVRFIGKGFYCKVRD
jgi:hypothetical protein